MLITKEEFTEYIIALRNVWDFQREVTDLMNKYKPYCQTSILDYPSCEDELLTLLEKVTGDNFGLISYFCYELNFGRDWQFISDSEFQLATIDDLWRELNK